MTVEWFEIGVAQFLLHFLPSLPILWYIVRHTTWTRRIRFPVACLGLAFYIVHLFLVQVRLSFGAEPDVMRAAMWLGFVPGAFFVFGFLQVYTDQARRLEDGTAA